MASEKQVVEAAREAGLALVRFLYCDNSSIIRGKSVPLPQLERRLTDGVGLARALLAVNSQDDLQPVPEMTPVGEVRLLPDLETFTLLPYAPGAGALLCNLVEHDSTPWEACPRWFLQRVCRRAAAYGIRAQASFEMEYTLATRNDGRYHPFDETLCYSSIAMQATHAFTLELLHALQSQGLAVELCHPELGPGQHEISVAPCNPLQAADNQIRMRETTRAVAAAHSLYASFAPKPFPDSAGNGAHIHLSLWDANGHNLFYDPQQDHGLSPVARSFIAGILAHLPGLTALTCGSVNSYRRLGPHSLSGAFAVYGYDNREAALRIPSPFWSDAEQSTNLELKAADASGNPYLALGGLLAAGLDGLEQQLDPGAPVDVDPDTFSEGERQARGICPLPATLGEALDALAADEVLVAALGPLLLRSYLAIKRSEVIAFSNVAEQAEIAAHFYKY